MSRPHCVEYEHRSTCTKIEFLTQKTKTTRLSNSSKIYVVAIKCEMLNDTNFAVEQNACNIEYMSW